MNYEVRCNMMNRFIFLLICILLQGRLTAQDIKNIFAYRHTVPMGNIPRFPKNADTANGEPQQEIPVRPLFQYHIFVSVSNNKPPVITTTLLGAKPVTFRLEKITALPQVYSYFDGRREQKITLIDSRQKNVYQLVLIMNTAGEKNEMPANKITLTYWVGGKARTKSVAAIKDLPSGIRY